MSTRVILSTTTEDGDCNVSQNTWAISTGSSGHCWSCNTWPCSCATTWTPFVTYTLPDTRAAELKAWLDGYMTDRKMTDKALKRIRDKLKHYVDEHP